MKTDLTDSVQSVPVAGSGLGPVMTNSVFPYTDISVISVEEEEEEVGGWKWLC